MKNNKKEIYLIIITTFFSVIIMVFSFSIKQSKSYIDEKIEESEEDYLDKDILSIGKDFKDFQQNSINKLKVYL